MADFAKESGHWYEADGSPKYTIIGANGKERNTTLRDARKLNLVPSVTTIIRESAKPALEEWKTNQAILAALTIPRIENEPEELFLKRVKADAREQSINAAQKGTDIHGYIERGISGQPVPPEGEEFVALAKAELEAHFPLEKWSNEKSFSHACSAGSYAGKVDLHCSDAVIDIKTNEKQVADAKLWDEHLMQLAAYSVGLGVPLGNRSGILFINHKDKEARIVFATKEQLYRGFSMFSALLMYFYSRTQL